MTVGQGDKSSYMHLEATGDGQHPRRGAPAAGGPVAPSDLRRLAEVAFAFEDRAVLVALAKEAGTALEHAGLSQEIRRRDRARHEFLALLAHELRSPLATIANGLRLLRYLGQAAGDAEATWAMMERQLGRLVRVADDLRDLSPPACDRSEVQGSPVSARSDGPRPDSESEGHVPDAAVEGGVPVEAHPVDGGEEASVRVLVVDDNADSADSLALLLAQLGHETRVVYDGQAALDELRRGWAHVAVLDIGMPDMSGYEVAVRWRESGAGARPVLVALTGWGQDEDRARAEAVGFSHHLTKPVDFDVLGDLLRRVHVNP